MPDFLPMTAASGQVGGTRPDVPRRGCSSSRTSLSCGALRINLRTRQYDVTVATTGREALALAVSRPPDAVILDFGLPDMDGVEVIVELRRTAGS